MKNPLKNWLKLDSGKIIPIGDIAHIGELQDIRSGAPANLYCYTTNKLATFHLSEDEYNQLARMATA